MSKASATLVSILALLLAPSCSRRAALNACSDAPGPTALDPAGGSVICRVLKDGSWIITDGHRIRHRSRDGSLRWENVGIYHKGIEETESGTIRLRRTEFAPHPRKLIRQDFVEIRDLNGKVLETVSRVSMPLIRPGKISGRRMSEL